MGILNNCLTKFNIDTPCDDRDKMFYGVIPMLIRESKKYITLIKTKDEIEDIEQSLILFCYKCIDSFNENKGAKFSTYLTLRLRDFNYDFISKYYGIKTSRSQLQKYKEQYGKELKFYFEPIDDIEL